MRAIHCFRITRCGALAASFALLGAAGCRSYDPREWNRWGDRERGTVIGGAGGAALGGAIGSASGNTGTGALLGGAVGAGAGNLIGRDRDEGRYRRDRDGRRYRYQGDDERRRDYYRDESAGAVEDPLRDDDARGRYLGDPSMTAGGRPG